VRSDDWTRARTLTVTGPGGAEVDSGRLLSSERMVLRARPGQPARLVARSDKPVRAQLLVAGRKLNLEPVAGDAWGEVAVDLPAELVQERNTIEIRWGSERVSMYVFLLQ
jgi:hypothetical protein